MTTVVAIHGALHGHRMAARARTVVTTDTDHSPLLSGIPETVGVTTDAPG